MGGFRQPGGGAALDPTAADIQPVGTRAAGANGLAADSGHVHPTTITQTLLAADINPIASNPAVQVLVTSPVLQPGTYKVAAWATFTGTATGVHLDLFLAAGTATATGFTSSSAQSSSSAGNPTNMTLDAEIVVTVAGTITLSCEQSGTSAIVAKAASVVAGIGGATGIVIERVA